MTALTSSEYGRHGAQSSIMHCVLLKAHGCWNAAHANGVAVLRNYWIGIAAAKQMAASTCWLPSNRARRSMRQECAITLRTLINSLSFSRHAFDFDPFLSACLTCDSRVIL